MINSELETTERRVVHAEWTKYIYIYILKAVNSSSTLFDRNFYRTFPSISSAITGVILQAIRKQRVRWNFGRADGRLKGIRPRFTISRSNSPIRIGSIRYKSTSFGSRPVEYRV